MKNKISLTKFALMLTAFLCLIVGFVLLGQSNAKNAENVSAEGNYTIVYGDNLVTYPSPDSGGSKEDEFMAYENIGRIYATARNCETTYKDPEKTIVDYPAGSYYVFYGKPSTLDTSVICSRNFYDLTDYDFSSGSIHFLLQGGLGGYKNTAGKATMLVRFYDQNTDQDSPIAISSSLVGPSVEERGEQTSLMTRKMEETVPVNAKYAKIFIYFDRTQKTTNPEGHARDIVLKIEDAPEITNATPESEKETNNGYITLPTCASPNATVSVNVYPNTGYVLGTLFVDGEEVDGKSFTMPEGPATISASFIEFKFSTITASLQNNIQLNYKISRLIAKQFTDLQIKFTFNGQESIVTDYSVQGDDAVFKFADVGIQQMGDTITAELSGKIDGVTKTAIKEYSVKQYCYDLLLYYSEDQLTRTLAVDTLNLGAASQKLFKYDTENLVNADLTPEQQGWATPERKYVNSLNTKYAVVDTPRLALNAMQLLVENNNAIDLQFALAVGEFKEGDYVEIVMPNKSGVNLWRVNVGNLSPVTIHTKDGDIPGYAGFFKGLDATVLSELLYLTVYDKDGKAVSNTTQYSVETYVASKYDSVQIPNLAQFVKAVMSYGDSAKAYAQGK